MMMVVSITWSVFDSGTKFLIGVPEGTDIPLGPSGSAWKVVIIIAFMCNHHMIHLHIDCSYQTIGHYWSLLVTIGHYWSLLVTIGTQRARLEIFHYLLLSCSTIKIQQFIFSCSVGPPRKWPLFVALVLKPSQSNLLCSAAHNY